MVTFFNLRGATIYIKTTGNDGTGAGTSGNPYLTLNKALSVISSGDIIDIGSGTYSGVLNYAQTTAVNITIQGAGAGTTIFDGGAADRWLSISGTANVSISAMTIQNMTIAGFGAGIYHQSTGTVTVTNVTFSSCTSTASEGAGIYCATAGHLTISGCTFSSNAAAKGAGISYQGTGNLTVGTSSAFASNTVTAAGFGAAIYCGTTATSCSITNSTFTSNLGSGATLGHAIYLGISSTITSCTFTTNGAAGGGYGTIFLSVGGTISSSTFTSNLAYFGASIRFIGASALSITNCTFTSNRAEKGGVISATGTGSVTISNCTATSNITTGDGAGFNIDNASVVPTFSNCTFTAGTGGSEGAGYLNCSSATFTDCIFSNNITTTDNPGIKVVGGTVQFTRCKFTGNSCTNAVTNYASSLSNNGGTTTLTSCLFYSNVSPSAQSGTGVVVNVSGTLTLMNCTVASNTDGSAALMLVAGTMTVTNCIIYSNTSTYSLNNTGGTGTMTYSNYSTKNGTWNTLTGVITTDPGFTNTVGNDYSLRYYSPAINNGTSTGAPVTDYSSTARPQYSGYDMGCYEFVCGASYSGVYYVGPTGTWSTITLALSELNNCMTDDVILEIQSTYTDASETYPLDFSHLPTTSSITLTIRPKSDVASTLTFDESSITTLLLFDNTDYVTIDGRPGGVGSNQYITIENTSTASGGSTIKFINDATNNTIKYCTLKSNFTSSTWGVVWFSTTTATTGNDNNTITYCVIDGTAGATASPTSGVAQNGIYSLGTTAKTNSGNSITYNEFKDIYIDANGSTSSMIFLDGYNDTWTISNNSFYQSSTRTSTGANVVGFEVINIDDGDGHVISSNYIGGSSASVTGTWTITQASTSRTNFYGIDLAVGTTTATSVQGNIIKNITWGFYNGMDNFAFIYCSSGKVNIGTVTGNQIGATTGTGSIQLVRTSTSTVPNIYGIQVVSLSTVSIQNNIIGAISTSNVSGVGFNFFGIVSSGAAGIFTINSNVIGSTTSAGSIAIGGSSTAAGVCAFTGITNSATGLATINTNTVRNCSVYGTGASVIIGVNNSGSATNSTINSNSFISLSNATIGSNGSAFIKVIYNTSVSAIDISSNTITSITCNNGYFIGIQDQVASTGAHTITLNIIGGTTSNDISIPSASMSNTHGISIGNTGTYTINSNCIRNITQSGAAIHLLSGINVESTGTYNMSKNYIKNLINSNTGAYAGTVYGIYFSAANASSTIQKNRITGCSSAGTSTPTVAGICIASTGTLLIYNNVITCTNGGNTNNVYLYGIYANTTSILTIYHNTISIGGSPSSGSASSMPFFQSYNGGVGLIVACKNNIFQNLRTNSGSATGSHYCYYLYTATAMTASACNNNFYYAPIDAVFANVGGVAKTAAQFNSNSQGFGGVASKYSLSLAVDQTTGVVPAATTANIVNQGVYLSGIVPQDHDDNARNNPPWIGAFEAYVVLPIELLYFEGKKEGRNNILNWRTVTEINNDYFTVEKTTNGVDFEIVGIENGAGTSMVENNYLLLDYNVISGVNYYRLKQTDFDGTNSYSDLISIDNTDYSIDKEILYKTNILGQEIDENFHGIVIIVYTDGKSIKIYK